MEKLPCEILIKIFVWSHLKELKKLALTSKTMLNILNENYYWKRRCNKHYNSRHNYQSLGWKDYYKRNIDCIQIWETHNMLIMYAECGKFESVLKELKILKENVIDNINDADIQTLVSLSIIGLSWQNKQFVKQLIKNYGKMMYIPNIFYGNDEPYTSKKYHSYRFNNDDELIYWIEYILKHCDNVRENAKDFNYMGEAYDIVENIYHKYKELITPKMLDYMLTKLTDQNIINEIIADM